jgi:hypothetical protein
MGWELQEIDEVRREYRRKPQDNPVDYTLFLNRTACLLIEAKSLEKDLGDRKWISQNISHAARLKGATSDRHHQFDPIIRRIYEVLFRAKIALRSLHGCVAQEQLDLLQFATRSPAHLRA